jgi:heme-degrading monooxygenase HmoA
MPHILVHIKVRSFAQWKPAFDSHEATRKNIGSKGVQVFQSAEDPSEIFILFEWDSVDNAKKFLASDDLKKAMEQGGVVEMHHVHFLTEAGKSKA